MGIEYYGGPRTLNGLTVESQTFAVASSGTDFNVASSGSVHTLSIPDASFTARGLISTGTQTIAGAKTFSGTISASNLSNTNTGDQTTIVGITGTKAQFDTSVTDGNFLYVGDAPTSHAHGNITNAGAIGSTTGLPIVTTASGVLTAGSFGTTAGTFAAGDDSRITGALSTSTAAATYAVIAAGQPTSGTVGQVLAKNSGTNYDSSWTSLVLGDRYLSTSTTSNAVSNGTKTFTIGTGLAYTPTQNITIAYDVANHMHGEVTTYNSGTGVLVVDINNHTGTGTYTSWVVNVGGVTPETVVAWGDIIGTLGTQSDLSTALNAKLEITTAASTYVALAGSYTDPAWIVSIPNTKVTGLGTLSTQNGTFSGTSSGTNTGDQDLSSYLTASTATSTYVPLTRTLNTLALSADQAFAVGTTGTDFAIVSAAGTHTFNIPDAGASARGLVTTGTQTIAGAKTFSGAATLDSTLTFSNNSGIRFSAAGGGAYTAAASYHLFYSDAFTTQVARFDNSTGSLEFRINDPACRVKWFSGTSLHEDSANILASRNSTNAQTFRVYNTYTSSTNFETLQFKAVAASSYQIGSAVGSAGGSNRDLNFGSWDTAGTFASSFYVGSTYAGINDSKIFYVGTSSRIEFSALSSLGSPAIRFAWGGGSPACVYGGSNTLGVGINGFTRLLFSVSSTDFTGSPFTISNTAVATGAYTGFTFTGAAHTNQTASTEATMVNWNLAQTVQFATGALTTQRAMRIQAPTYGFVGASTITTASTLSISGPPVAGTNATITNAYALNVESGGILLPTGRAVTMVNDGYIGQSDTSGLWFQSSGTVRTYIRNEAGDQKFWFVNGASGFAVASTSAFHWSALASAYSSPDLFLYRDAAGILAQRNSTNAQTFRVYGTYTSATSYERLNVKGVASANFEIGPENGSAGGTLRGFTIGGYSAGTTTITPWLTFTNAGVTTVNQGTLVIASGGTGLLCQQTNIYLDSYGTHSGLRFRRSEGTQASPTGVAFNSLVGFVATFGYYTGGIPNYHTTKGASIDFYSTEAYTSTAQGTKIVFGTTPNGTTTNTPALTIDQNQVATFSKLIAQSAAEITSTPTGTTQTITLKDGNHQTLALTSATGTVTVTLTVPSNVSAGTLIIEQHATTVRDLTWAVSAGTIKWMGAQPTWSGDATSSVRIVSWRYNGSVMYLASTDVAV